MNDKTAVFVRSFPVGKHTVTMMLTRRRFSQAALHADGRRLSRVGSQRRKGRSIELAARLLLPMPTAP
jgi:hypothetical protein